MTAFVSCRRNAGPSPPRGSVYASCSLVRDSDFHDGACVFRVCRAARPGTDGRIDLRNGQRFDRSDRGRLEQDSQFLEIVRSSPGLGPLEPWHLFRPSFLFHSLKLTNFVARMRCGVRFVCALVIGLIAGAPAAYAQPVPGETDAARVRIGPLSVKPTFAITNIGVDSNVFNQSDVDHPRQDFTITASPKADWWLRAG